MDTQRELFMFTFDEAMTLIDHNLVLTRSVVSSSNRWFTDLKCSKDRIAICGELPCSQTNLFNIALGLSTKQRLGVVDIYHGGKTERKEIYSNRPVGFNLAIFHTASTSPKNNSPLLDPLPNVKKLSRLSIRQELTRPGQQQQNGTWRRRSINDLPPVVLRRDLVFGHWWKSWPGPQHCNRFEWLIKSI